MTAARHAALLALDPEIGHQTTRALEAAGYIVDFVRAQDVEGRLWRVDLEAAIGELVLNEPEVLVTGPGMFPASVAGDESLTLGMRGTFVACKVVVRTMMRKRFGRLLALSPTIGTSHVPAASALGGLGGLMKSIAREIGTRGITANVIAPGDLSVEEGEVSPYISVGRLTLPEDIAAAVGFLISADAAYVTGQVIHVDGGVVTA